MLSFIVVSFPENLGSINSLNLSLERNFSLLRSESRSYAIISLN